MIFNRTSHLRSELSIEEIKKRLLHQRIQLRGMDFEVSEKEQMIKIIPRAERVENIEKIQTLPITHVDIMQDKDGTRVKIFSKPRRIDAGGPYMVVIFCLFCVAGAGLFYLLDRDSGFLPSLVMIGVALLIFIILWYRMNVGYFDYVRKIKQFVHGRISSGG